MRKFILAFDLVICAVTMAVMKSGRARAFLGPVGLENYATVLLFYGQLHMVFRSSWYLAKILGQDRSPLMKSQAAIFHADYMLTNLAFFSLPHMALPIRWLCFLPSEVAAVLSYILPGALLGSPVKLQYFIVDCLCMVVCSGFMSYGKHRMEYYERLAFASIAVEKTLRFQLEHKLQLHENCAHELSVGTSSTEASTSLPETTLTARMFNRLDNGSGEAQGSLELIGNLGYNEHWHVKAAELHPVANQIVGCGGFGILVPALLHGKAVVVKAPLSQAGAAQAQDVASIAQELRVFRHIRHPNVVMFYGGCIEPTLGGILLVLEYIPGVTLSQFAGKPPNDPSTADRCKVLDDICCALRYLHSRKPCIVHGDIKGTNVMVDTTVAAGLTAKLLDFGLSRLIQGGMKPMGGTLRWMPPEVILKCGSPKPSADVFCFGRLLYLVMTGCTPLAGVGPAAILACADANCTIELEWPQDVPLLQEARQLCTECVRLDPSMRPPLVDVHARIADWMGLDDRQCRLSKFGDTSTWDTDVEPGADIWRVLAAARATAWRIKNARRGLTSM